jgi:glycosyltransferase involved in cell wall biosynthesis
MHSSPLISIITLTYNHERYLPRCIDSVLQQTYSKWEQIIIDDGSTDGTRTVASACQDPRIRYEHQLNQGPFELARTYNRALSLAKGELIAILEGDDFWPRDRLELQIPAFRDPAVVLSYGERTDVDARGIVQRRKTRTLRSLERLPDSVRLNDPPGSASRLMLTEQGRSLVHPCTVMIQRRALEQIGGFQYVAELPLTDYPTFLELSLLGKFSFIRRCLGYLRRHQHSITVNYPRTIHESVAKVATEFVERHSTRLALTSVDWLEIRRGWQRAEDRLHFSEGRTLLLQKRWSEARAHFRVASKSSSFGVHTAALAGFLLSLAHMNIEPLMKLGGRSDLRSSRSGAL